MYAILASSKITLNHHGDVGPFANNLRLFEATGMGALLITDWKPNLSEYFDAGREAVAYRTAEECVEKVRYYLRHDDERITIAAAGQNRTLTEHTWPRRMRELVEIVERHGR
jgi:spore maturation protein CgeB